MRILRLPQPYAISEHLKAFSVPGRPSPHLLHGNLWTVVLDSPLAFEIGGSPGSRESSSRETKRSFLPTLGQTSITASSSGPWRLSPG